MHRTGAALILALILLAALLLLGLPFLFSQSSSLSGTRSFADSKSSQIARDSAANLAVAVASYAMERSMRVSTIPTEQAEWTSLTGTFAPENPLTPAGLKAAVAPVDTYNLSLLPEQLSVNGTPMFNAPDSRVSIGATISDESGKLNPNAMSAEVWALLFFALQISDWDDHEVVPVPPVVPPDWRDGDALPELAQALASLRERLPGGRIMHLEQLLEADPQAGGHPNLRHRLTRAELELLRPHLTLHNPGPGRRGLIDLGTVVATDSSFPTWYIDSTDAASLVAYDTALVGQATDPATNAHARAFTRFSGYPDGPLMAGRHISNKKLASSGLVSAGNTERIAIEAPGAVNFHQLSPVVRTALGVGQTPVTYPLPSGVTIVSLPPPLPDPTAVPTPDAATDVKIYRTTGSLAQVYIPGTPSYYQDLYPYISPLGLAGSQLPRSSETPPIGVRSLGVFAIESSSHVLDPLGRQTAQELRRDVVQALPQEYLLESRWLTQSQIDASLAQRFGSHVQSWPIASERRKDTPPDDPDLSAGGTAKPLTGLRNAALPDIATVPIAELTHLALDWKVTFGGDQAVADAQVFDAQQVEIANGNAVARITPVEPAAPASSADAIVPDGYHHQSGDELAYRLRGLGGAEGKGSIDALVDRPVSVETTHELSARHLSLWMRPEGGDWNGSPAVIPIFESRMSAGTSNATSQTADFSPSPDPAAGSNGDPDSQNYIGMFYDAVNQMLVVAIAPPSVEHTYDYWKSLTFPFDDQSTPTLDERCLPGSGGVLAPKQTATGGLLTLFGGKIYKDNRVLHCYKTPNDSSGKPHFRRNQWYHVQVALASDRPDGVSILLDGIAGRDAAKTQAAMDKLGDHFTFPCLILGAQLDYQDTSADPTKLLVPSIPVSLPANVALTVTDLLPASGMVRIDDEYISYQSITGSGTTGTLVNCVRGQRQDTYVSDPTDPTNHFPNVQGHAKGALVAPGGYRVCALTPNPLPPNPIPPTTAKIYRGGCVLSEGMANGSVLLNPANDTYTVWSRLDNRMPAITVPGWHVLPAAAVPNEIPLDGTGDVTMFPSEGIVLVQGQYLYYKGKSGNNLQNVSAINTWNTMPSLGAAARSDIIWPDSAVFGPMVLLVSVGVAGADPNAPGLYTNIAKPGLGNDFIMQIQDPANGRIEWVDYHSIVTSGGGGAAKGFFININGFAFDLAGPRQHRGVFRTPFTAKPPSPATAPWATGAMVLPVQTEFEGAGHWLATGDVVTLMPHLFNPSGVDGKPFQMVVRYAPRDGNTVAATLDPLADAKNEYFAFTDVVPATINAPAPSFIEAWKYDLISGTCWSGDDLSPMKRTFGPPVTTISSARRFPRGYLPRIDLWSTAALGATSTARIYFGGQAPNAPSRASADLSLDAISAGPLQFNGGNWDGHESSSGTARPNTIVNGIVRFIKGGAFVYAIGSSGVSDIDDLVAQATTPLFGSSFAKGKLGLVEIDGEVFAYEQLSEAEATAVESTMTAQKASDPSNFSGLAVPNAASIRSDGYFAKLIARGLLDATNTFYQHDIMPGPALIVSGSGTQFAPHRTVLTAIRLPLGPVLRLNDALTVHKWATLTDSDGTVLPVPATPLRGAPAALFCKPTGNIDDAEMIQLIGPNKRATMTGFPGTPVPNLDEGKYTTADWIKGMYNTKKRAWTAADKAIVIGWWPRYASALPASGSAAKEHFSSRSFAWVGFPATVYGGYFSKGLLASFPSTGPFPYQTETMANVAVIEDFSGFFSVEARALADNDNWSTVHWAAQTGVLLSTTSSDASDAFWPTNDLCECFSQGGLPVPTAKPVDGAELRVTWHYADTPSSLLSSIASSGNRSPIIGGARVRCLAPVRVLANERAR
jgi:hypothetical protein